MPFIEHKYEDEINKRIKIDKKQSFYLNNFRCMFYLQYH